MTCHHNQQQPAQLYPQPQCMVLPSKSILLWPADTCADEPLCTLLLLLLLLFFMFCCFCSRLHQPACRLGSVWRQERMPGTQLR
jgi:hypothetical protein